MDNEQRKILTKKREAKAMSKGRNYQGQRSKSDEWTMSKREK